MTEAVTINFNASHAQARRASAEGRHLTARTGMHEAWWSMVQSLLAQRERRNMLPWLTPEKSEELFEAWFRGETAELQAVWHMLERYDETLHIVLRARLGAIEDMNWSVTVDASAVGDNAARQQLADAQKDYLNAVLGNVENLRQALRHLAMADFRGVAAVEVTGSEAHMRWEVIEPWLLCHPVANGPWMYNANADPHPYAPEHLDAESVILREAEPINLTAMFLIVAKRHGILAWDAFLDKFGIPSVFLETPPNTTEEQAAAYDALMLDLIGEGSGTIPAGAKFHTVETNKDSTDAFERRAKACDQGIIILGTGGLLTITTEAGSGTLAGNAHADSFARLCAATARDISEAVNYQFCRRRLAEKFPGQPILVAFELAPEKEDDRAAQAQMLATLAGAGFKPSAEVVSEMMGFEVAAVEQQPEVGSRMFEVGSINNGGFAAPIMNSTASGSAVNSINGQLSIVNGQSPESSPLSESELAALNALASGGITAEGFAEATQTAYQALAGTMQDAVTNSESEGKVHESGTPCKASERECPLDHQEEDKEPWEKRQEEREHLEELMAELDRQEDAARDAEASGDPTHYNEEAARDRWSSLSREGDPQTREDIEKRLAELDVEDKLDSVDPVEVSFTAEKKSGAEWAANAQQYFMEHYAGRTFAIGDTGHTLHVGSSKSRARLATKGANTQKRNESFKQLENVIARAVHISSEEAKAKAGQGHHKADIMAKTSTFEKYGAPAIINGEKCLIWFNAQTKEKGAKDVLLYEFGVSPMK